MLPLSKLLTPLIPVESVVKAQQRIIGLTPAQEERVKYILRTNPSGGVSITYDAKTGEIQSIDKAK